MKPLLQLIVRLLGVAALCQTCAQVSHASIAWSASSNPAASGVNYWVYAEYYDVGGPQYDYVELHKNGVYVNWGYGSVIYDTTDVGPAVVTYTAYEPTGYSNYAVTISAKAAQAAVTSQNATVFVGSPFTPAYFGGSGSGNWQFVIAGYTNIPGDAGRFEGEAGTILEPAGVLSPTWTPTQAGNYEFWVRKYGDDSYQLSNWGGPYTLTVLANPTGSIQILDEGSNAIGLDGNGRARVAFGRKFGIRVSGAQSGGTLSRLYSRVNRADGTGYSYQDVGVSGSSASYDFGQYTADMMGVWDVWGHVVSTGETGYQWNGGGWFGTHSPDIEVYNTAPSAAINIKGASSGTVSGVVGETLSITVSGSDADGNLRAVNLWVNTPVTGWRNIRSDSTLNSGYVENATQDNAINSGGSNVASLGPVGRTFTITLNEGFGTYQFHARAIDAAGTTSATAVVDVSAANRAPDGLALTGAPATLLKGQSANLTSDAHDADGNLSNHMLWRRGPRPADTFGQDWNGWLHYVENPSDWSNIGPNPGIASGGTNSSKSATYTPPQGGYWQFHANAWDALGVWASGATTGAVFVAPLPTASIAAAGTSLGNAIGGGSFVAYTTDTVSVSYNATAEGWLSGHSILAYTGTTSPQQLVGVSVNNLPAGSANTSSAINGMWTPPAHGTFTLYTEAFTGRTSGERINGTSGYPGYLDQDPNKRITVAVRRNPTMAIDIVDCSPSRNVIAPGAGGRVQLLKNQQFYVRVLGSDPDGGIAQSYVRMQYPDTTPVGWQDVAEAGSSVQRDFGPYVADIAGIWRVWGHIKDDAAPDWGAVSPWNGNAHGWATLYAPDLEVGNDPDVDSDGDGLPDIWEICGGLNRFDPNDAATDLDGDGLSNVAEYNLDFDPSVSDSAASEGGILQGDWPVADTTETAVVGITAGELMVDRSGAATYSIPIWVTPGTAGMQPNLSLAYSSQGGVGPLGLGWSLQGLSTISRVPQTLAHDNAIKGITLTGADRFALDGQRLILIGGTYGAAGSEYRTALESFTRVVAEGTRGSGPASFKAWTKAGLIIEFGNTSDSAFDAFGRSEAMSWVVNKISDTVGNSMEFHYLEDAANGDHRIDRIEYTLNPAQGVTTPYAYVEFEWEEADRPDWIRGYVAGSPVSSLKRLLAIRVYVKPPLAAADTVVRSYEFAYIERAYTGRSLLKSITERGTDGKALRPLQYEYSQAVQGWTDATAYYPPYLLADNTTEKPTGAGFIDVNGDGLPDALYHLQFGSYGAWLNTGSGFAWTAAYTPPAPLSSANGDDTGVRFADLNGDGLIDMVQSWYNSSGSQKARTAWINTGSGWQESAAWAPPGRIAQDGNTPERGTLIDMNGDGRPDLVTHLDPGTYGWYGQWVYINTGTGWSPTPSLGFGTFDVQQYNVGTYQGRYVDLNADGLPDLVVSYQSGGTTKNNAWLNTGSGWLESSDFHLPVIISDGSSSSLGVEFTDLNGDALPDMTWWRAGHDSERGVAINDGKKWIVGLLGSDLCNRYGAQSPMAFDNRVPTPGAIIDLNADGIPDWPARWIQNGLTSAWTNYGTLRGWADAGTGHDLPTPLTDLNEISSAGRLMGVDFVDLDGNGATDCVLYRRNAGGGAAPRGAWINNASQADRLVSVENGFGVTASISYKPLTDATVYAKGTGSLHPVFDVIGPMLVVSRIDHADGAGGTYGVTYVYGGLRGHALRGNLGFEWMSTLDTRTSVLSTTEFAQAFPFTGMPLEAFTQTAAGTGVTLSESSTIYDTRTSHGDKVWFVFAKSSTSRTRDLDGSLVSETTTITQQGPAGQYTDYDAYGNSLYVQVDLGDGYTKTTTSLYENVVDATRWHLGRLTSSTVVSTGPSTPSITRKSAFTYRSGDGLLESETVEPDFASAGTAEQRRSWLQTIYGYDGFGNKTSVEVKAAGYDPFGGTFGATVSHTSISQFDARGRFPEWTQNAKGHRETYLQYDQGLGVATQVRGPNQLVTSFELDGFGRVTRETRPDTTQSQVFRRWILGNAPIGARYYVETTGTGAAPAVEFFDSFGRSIRRLGVDGDGYGVATDTSYDAMGRAFQTSVPFRTVHGSPSAWTKILAYDVLNRPLVVLTPDDQVTGASSVTITLPDNSTANYSVPAGAVATTTRYNGRISWVSNPKGVVTRTTTNGQGWEIEVVQNETGLVLDASSVEQTTLTKAYDAVGNLVATTTAGTTITHAYDIRGRRVHTVDPDMGTWTYLFNGFGELVEQTDAKFQKTQTSYDALGRPSRRDVLTSAGPIEERTDWSYDTAPGKGIGKLHVVETKNAAGTLLYRETHTYDGYGRPSATTRRIDGADHTTSVGYDAAGLLETTTYPTGFAVRNVYNAFGALKEVRRGDAGRNDVYWMAASDPDNSAAVGIARHLLGNGVTVDRTTSKATGRLRMIDAGMRNQWGLQQIAYDYDVLANVKTRIDATTGLSESAYCDALNRLHGFISVLGANVTDVDVDYAANGNITHKSDVGTYAYAGPRPHAVTVAGSNTYTYDANGQMTSGAGRTIQWTAFNQIKRIDGTGGVYSEFSFGASHERVKQVSAGGTTIYLGALYEKFTPTGANPVTEHRHWIMTPAGRLAVHKTFSNGAAAQTRYFLHDALGSITAATKENGAIEQRFRYDGWGKRLDMNGQPVLTGLTRGFTDHEQLDDLGLVHMNGRVYDPVLARFLSADPFIDGAGDSQGYNRYSYVLNNPLNATDPTGLLSFKDVVKIVAVVVVAYFTAGWGAGVLGPSISAGFGVSTAVGAGIGGGLAAGFASGLAGSLLNGGSLGDAFQAGVVGGVLGAVSGGIAAGIGDLAAKYNFYGDWQHHLLHGVSQGAVTEAAGGELRHGFYAAAFSSAASGWIGNNIPGGVIGETIAAAAVGGTASELGGGKFANGAASGAFTYLFNQAAHRAQVARSRSEGAKITAFQGRDGKWNNLVSKGSPGYIVPAAGPDGYLTLAEANRWYLEGYGESITVDATLLNFSGVNPSGFDPVTGQQLYRFPRMSEDFLVHGTVMLQLNSGGTSFRVLSEPYDFEMHSWSIRTLARNLETIAGSIAADPIRKGGMPFVINYSGNMPVSR